MTSLGVPSVFGVGSSLTTTCTNKLNNMLHLLMITRGVAQKKMFVNLVDFCGLRFYYGNEDDGWRPMTPNETSHNHNAVFRRKL